MRSGGFSWQDALASGRAAQTGSAARFTDVGVYLFDSEAAGRAFTAGFR